MNENVYVPGLCNIGPEEITRRQRVGWIGAAVTLVYLALMALIGANPWWRLIAFFPAALSASGFLQAYFHFCSGFARRGVFNFGTIGQTTVIADDASKEKDRAQGNRIMWYALAIGAVIALSSVFMK